MNLIICGLSKNCLDTTKNNIASLVDLKNYTKDLNLQIIIVDSDSNDGSKEFLEEVSNKYKYISVIHEDGLEDKYQSRIERIAHCRNQCLEAIKRNNYYQNFLYIPMDFDINQFEITSHEEFFKLVKEFKEVANADAMFPVSYPFYYDIFALRADGWVNINSQLIVNKLKKYLRIGSFFWNYIFIFRKQWSPEKIAKKELKIKSAFGGCGIYRIGNNKLKNIKYSYSRNETDFVSEHIFFNEYFNDLKVETSWIVPAPTEHLSYKSQNKKGKIIYFFKTLKFDLKNIFNFS